MTPRARRTAAAALGLALCLPSAAAAGPRILAAAGVSADPARDAAWQRFFGGLPHGRELDALTVVLDTPPEVTRRCGRGTDGCYSDLLHQMVIPGAAGPGDTLVADIARHEYGHHLAAASDNAPFADFLGTKRWFTHERICERLRAGELSEDASAAYERSASEGFAEAYRVAAGGSAHVWIVDPALFPDLAARRAILADARRPWAGGRTRRFAGRLSPRRPKRAFALQVPLDGTVRAEVTMTGSLRAALTLADGSRVLAHGRRVRFVDCGRRVLRLVVRARGGRGRFRVSAVVP
jgi:hypothetical protein